PYGFMGISDLRQWHVDGERVALRRLPPSLLVAQGHATGRVGDNAPRELALDEDEQFAHLRSDRCNRWNTSSSLDGSGTRLSLLEEGGSSSPRDARRSSTAKAFRTKPSSALGLPDSRRMTHFLSTPSCAASAFWERPFSFRFSRTARPSCSEFCQ